jgi:hypothetical protein
MNVKAKDVFFPHWKKNEIVRPVSFAINQFILVLAIIYILVLFIQPVTAETLSGTIDYSSIVSNTATALANGDADTYYMHSVFINNIENSYGTTAFIHYDNQAAYRIKYPAGMALNGKSIPIIIKLTNVNGIVLCSGTLGYQRLYNAGGSEINGYQYIEFNTEQWNNNIIGLTGDKYLYLDYQDSTLGGVPYWSPGGTGDSDSLFEGGMNFGAYVRSRDRGTDGIIQVNKLYTVTNSYTATKPSGLGITGFLNKTVNGVTYPSKGLIYNAITGALITSDNLVVNSSLPFNVVAESIIIGVKTSTGVFVNSTPLFNPPVTPPSEYFITVSPAWIPSGGSQYLYGEIHKQGSANQNLTEIVSVSWSWHKMGLNGAPNGDEIQYTETTNSDNLLTYSASTGIYKGWSKLTDSYSNIKTATLPNPLSLNPVGASGSILTTLIAYDNLGNSYKFNVSNLVGNSNGTIDNTMKVITQDAYTGGILSPSKISVFNGQKGTWQNITTAFGEYTFNIPVGIPVTIAANVSGYLPLVKTFTTTENAIEHMNMFKAGIGGDLNKTKIIIYTRSTPSGNLNSQPLENVYVSLIQNNDTSLVKSDVSGVTGIVEFQGNISTAYSITGSKTGFVSASKVINTGVINPYEVYLYLTPLGVISPTPTFPPIVTPSPQPIVTPAAWSNGNASVCGVVADNRSILDYLKSQAACNGFKDAMSQSLLIAAIIIMLCMSMGAAKGKAAGGIVGAIVGFVLAFALGVIPFMVLALIIVLLVLVAMIYVLAKAGA